MSERFLKYMLEDSWQVFPAHRSGSDGHVVPVAGWPLGNTVAAQVLVDASHLVRGHIITHLQVWVVAVSLGATHVHCVQHVLAIYHSDLPLGEDTETRLCKYSTGKESRLESQIS